MGPAEKQVKEKEEEEEEEESKTLSPLLQRFCALHRLRPLLQPADRLAEEFGQLTALTHCDLSYNKLSSLPRGFGRLTALTSCNLSYNLLTALTHCDLSYNQLTALLSEFGRLTALTRCDLSYNKLTALPSEFGRLTALTFCNLSNNELTALPSEFGRLSALTHCDLSDNLLSSLPSEFGRLTTLNSCRLDGNPLAALPCSMLWLLPSLKTSSPQPFQRQEALLQQTEENEEEEQEQEEEKQEKEEKKERAKPKQAPATRYKQAAVKNLWHLSGEAVLRNQLLPPGLLTAVRDPPPFSWLSSSPLKVERTTRQQQGPKEERKEKEGRGEEVVIGVVLPEEVKERLQRLQRRCDVCAQLFLEVEAEAEEEQEEKEAAKEEGQAEEVVRRHWDEERGVWWELLCCSQSCFHWPLPAACSLAPKKFLLLLFFLSLNTTTTRTT
ncbi:hypothetical protein QOT17_002765 [Balamuthia mandrillaris]